MGKHLSSLPGEVGAAVDGVAFSFAARTRRSLCRSGHREIIARMNHDSRAPIGDNNCSGFLRPKYAWPAISTSADIWVGQGQPRLSEDYVEQADGTPRDSKSFQSTNVPRLADFRRCIWPVHTWLFSACWAITLTCFPFFLRRVVPGPSLAARGVCFI